MAVKTAKKSVIEKGADNLKNTAKNIHNQALLVSEDLVEGSLATGAKWQKIMAKALTQGTVIFGKQQDLAFDTLEELKDQYISGSQRVQKLLGFKFPTIGKAIKTKKAVKVAKVTKVAKITSKPAKAAKKVVSKKVATTVKKVEKKVTATKATKDKLTAIEGVGPKIAGLLNKAGINNFAQLTKTNLKDLQAILDAAGPRYKMHDPKTWKAQAKKLMK